MSDKPKKPRTKSERRHNPKTDPDPEVKVEPILKQKVPEKSSGSNDRGRSPTVKVKTPAKPKPEAKPKAEVKLVDVPRRDYDKPVIDNSISASHYNGHGIGYLKEQLQLRGLTFTNDQLKKTY